MDIASLKVQDLKSELKARGLTTSGTKSELISRLVQAMTAAATTMADNDNSGTRGNGEELNDSSFQVCGGPVTDGEHDYLISHGLAMEDSFGELYGEPSTIIDSENSNCSIAAYTPSPNSKQIRSQNLHSGRSPRTGKSRDKRQDDSVLDDDLLEDEDSMLGDEDDLDADVLDAAVGTGSVTSTTAVSSSSPSKVTPAATGMGSSSVITSSVGSTSPKKVLVTSNQNADDEQKKKKLTINREPVEPAAPPPASTTEQKSVPSTKTSITAPESTSTTADKKPLEAVKVLNAAERAQLRAQKFGAGAAGTPTEAAAPITDEKLKKRAEKFGSTPDLASTPAKISLTTEESLRLAKRKERFGVVEPITGPAGGNVSINKGKTAGATPATTAPAVSKSVLDENKLKRAARFMLGAANSAEVEEKKKARADRFKN